MKVVHIGGGLGNQMLHYCTYLALRYIQPEEACYIETLSYDIPECDEASSLWNGYELDKVFGIKAPNVRELFTDDQWNSILTDVKESRFSIRDWYRPAYFCEVFRAHGLELNNLSEEESARFDWLRALSQIRLYNQVPIVWLRRIYNYTKKIHKLKSQYPKSESDMLFYTGPENAMISRPAFQKRNNHIEWIDQEIRQAFSFPPFADERNRSFSDYIRNHESISIHVRRGDMLPYNGLYYKTSYFKRAVRYIKSRIQDPVFIFFCDPGSEEYCRENLNKFSLNERDRIHFVEWNRGGESYRDMQLMSLCRHNIITNSSFGWWGAYLNENPDKITISPEIAINTTHHF